MEREEIIKGLESVEKECGKHFDESFAWICEPIDNAIKELEKETVSRESYYLLFHKVYKLDRLLEQADLALGDIKVALRSPNRDDIVDKVKKIVNKYDENVIEFFNFISQKKEVN